MQLGNNCLKKTNQYNGDDSRISIPVLRNLYTRAGPYMSRSQMCGEANSPQPLCTYLFRSHYDMGKPLLHL